MALSKGNNRALNFSISHPVEICVCAGKKKKCMRMFIESLFVTVSNLKQLYHLYQLRIRTNFSIFMQQNYIPQ